MEGRASDAKPAIESSPIRGEGVSVEECQRMIQRSIRTPMVKFLLENLENSGCMVADNFIKAVNCTEQISGGYTRGEGCKDVPLWARSAVKATWENRSARTGPLILLTTEAKKKEQGHECVHTRY